MKIEEVNGDLFLCDTKYAFAHCISFDCKMGAGIANEFVKRYKNLKPEVSKTILDNHLIFRPMVITYKDSKKIIFNLITKRKYYEKPTYTSLYRALLELKDLCKKLDIKHLAMPKIGCGLDRLKWPEVKESIEDVFKDQDIEIKIFIK